ncbi:MAG: YtxH domain-containing protein [Cyanobacteria bacterium HKST-UBA06]|nr:YtxH domain-containing protein [Cyanobacteria bacterium HKST-UBA05]MCA9798636.1 YtxH domain-containing protein [Cyanobacteria bacterium HKST-UBA04]MCA9807303.1 YtxH domain-containing protein [Cyanobacteria bacterium HKST-UBA06]MCA9841160.1 YtxH domain-containing protein [Cyanobacteria bacterium HKST-UBA03]
MSSERFLGGFILGGAIGALIGLLFAPRPGRETRQIIRDEFNNQLDGARGELEDRASEVCSTVREKADEIRNRAHEIADDLERAGIEAIDKVRSMKNEMKAAAAADESVN